MNFKLETPNAESLIRRMLDTSGYHDAESVPTEKVVEMFVAFFHVEHERHSRIREELNNWASLQPPRGFIRTSPPSE